MDVLIPYCSSFILLFNFFSLGVDMSAAAAEASDAPVCFCVLCRTDDASPTLRTVSVS